VQDASFSSMEKTSGPSRFLALMQDGTRGVAWRDDFLARVADWDGD
jgi:hypothetical protein